nr:hypothetical protein [Clostridia bacterium]
MPVSLYILERCDMSAALADASRFDHLPLASITFNGDMFPAMQTFLQQLVSYGRRDRRVYLIKNGSWAPSGQCHCRPMKNIVSKH